MRAKRQERFGVATHFLERWFRNRHCAGTVQLRPRARVRNARVSPFLLGSAAPTKFQQLPARRRGGAPMCVLGLSCGPQNRSDVSLARVSRRRRQELSTSGRCNRMSSRAMDSLSRFSHSFRQSDRIRGGFRKMSGSWGRSPKWLPGVNGRPRTSALVTYSAETDRIPTSELALKERCALCSACALVSDTDEGLI